MEHKGEDGGGDRAAVFAAGVCGLGRCASAGFYLFGRLPGVSSAVALARISGGTLDPGLVPKFRTPLLVPPVMPRADTITLPGEKPVDYYEISMRQFAQQILPAGLPPTTVWGYGAVAAQSNRGLLVHNAPSLTIEASWNRPVRVKWINDLVDGNGDFLPHLLPVDPTLHWANPPGGTDERDSRPSFTETPGRYRGPVPMVTHVHGAVGVADDSDGYAEAWYLPAANDIPAEYAKRSSRAGRGGLAGSSRADHRGHDEHEKEDPGRREHGALRRALRSQVEDNRDRGVDRREPGQGGHESPRSVLERPLAHSRQDGSSHYEQDRAGDRGDDSSGCVERAFRLASLRVRAPRRTEDERDLKRCDAHHHDGSSAGREKREHEVRL